LIGELIVTFTITQETYCGSWWSWLISYFELYVSHT